LKEEFDMTEYERINPSSQKEGMQQSTRKVPLWQRPALIFLGKVKDLVQGFGKSADNIDGGGGRKHGVG
jgi:hypothetical protein